MEKNDNYFFKFINVGHMLATESRLIKSWNTILWLDK